MVWVSCNKCPFFKLHENLLKCKQSQFTSASRIWTKHSSTCGVERWGLQFSQKSDIWWKNRSPKSIFGPQKLFNSRLNKSLSISTWMQWEGISVQWSTPKFSKLLQITIVFENVWCYMCSLMHAKSLMNNQKCVGDRNSEKRRHV